MKSQKQGTAATAPLLPVAITIHQPWAGAIVAGHKTFENRTWRPPDKIIGHRIWIHASARKDPAGIELMQRLGLPLPTAPGQQLIGPGQALLGTVEVVGYVRRRGVDDRFSFHMPPEAQARMLAEWPSPWLFGPVGWRLENARQLVEPIRCRGWQSVWGLSEELQRLTEKARFR